MTDIAEFFCKAPVAYLEVDHCQEPPKILSVNSTFRGVLRQMGFDHAEQFLAYLPETLGVNPFVAEEIDGEFFITNPKDGLPWTVRLKSLDPTRVGAILFSSIDAMLSGVSLFSLFFSGRGDVFWILNLKTLRFDYVSPSVVHLRGFTPEELRNQTLEDAVSPKQYPELVRVLEQRLQDLKYNPDAPTQFIDFVEQRHKSGNIVPTEVATKIILDEEGSPKLLLGLSRDISQRQSLEMHLNQARRLESLGLMAAGIAHDFNNMLMAVQGNLDLALLESPSHLVPYLSNANKILTQAASQIRQLMVFAGKAKIEKSVEDLNKVVQDCHTMFKVMVPFRITFTLDLAETVLPVEIDVALVQQLVLNLIQNAVDAMADGGELRLSTGVQRLGGDDLALLKEGTDLLPGDYAFLEVSDHGMGITAYHLDRIFEPFFTTKAVGKGLGLSSVLGIVRLHKGGLSVTSAVGKGTTFTVYLKLLAASQMTGLTEKEILPGLCAEIEKVRILVVDDEASIRQVVSQMLQLSGYQVDVAASGQEALRLIGGERRTYDLVLLDLTMPAMDGYEVIHHLKSLGLPLPKIVLMSGYHHKLEEMGADAGFDRYLTKPFRMDELCLLIEELLGKSQGNLDTKTGMG